MAFPDERDRELIHQAEQLVERATDLNEWVADFRSDRQSARLAVVSDREEFEALSLRRQAMNLYSSARVPAAAAVYGPSQVGKSLFVGQVLMPRDDDVSPLGRDEQHGPPAYFQHLSFTEDLNPQSGSNEATALVTRFTTKDRVDARVPPRFPVMVRALTRAEWLRVLARGFAAECRQSDSIVDNDSLEECFSQCSASDLPTDRSWRVDLLDTYAYVKRQDPLRYQADESVFNGLLSRYSLTADGCVELAAALFWNQWSSLTGLFRRIAGLIERIAANGTPGILCDWACVRFLLDSQRAPNHGNSASRCFTDVSWSDVRLSERNEWLVLEYESGRGSEPEDLATLQAAMLELVIPVLPHRLTENWSRVLEECDVLDIPGMRASRAGTEAGLRTSADTIGEQMEIVKRGKVLYLFDRYIEELQVQTLLLLTRGGNLEVRGQMKADVNKWGTTRYGKKWPQGVTDETPALFIGLTGIDEEFRNRSSNPGTELYDNRLRQLADTLDGCLNQFGGKQSKFRNVYPIRYPGTWDTNASQRAAEDEAKWNQAGEAFVRSECVQRFVGSPELRWKAAMADGDGGLSLISAGFRDCTGGVGKQADLSEAISSADARLRVLAESWTVPEDANLERRRREAHAEKIIEWLRSDPQKACLRVDALTESLCLLEGDTLALADFSDWRSGSTRLTADPLEEDFRVYLTSFLDEWATSIAPVRWQQRLARQNTGEPWLSVEQFHVTTECLRDYLTADSVFPELCSRLLSIVELNLRDEAARRHARRRYTRFILNDFIMNPGSERVRLNGTSGDGPSPGLMQTVVDRWADRLPVCFGIGAGEKVEIPAGNEDLVELVATWSES